METRDSDGLMILFSIEPDKCCTIGLTTTNISKKAEIQTCQAQVQYAIEYGHIKSEDLHDRFSCEEYDRLDNSTPHDSRPATVRPLKDRANPWVACGFAHRTGFFLEKLRRVGLSQEKLSGQQSQQTASEVCE